jgi:hypothetical protein
MQLNTTSEVQEEMFTVRRRKLLAEILKKKARPVINMRKRIFKT